MRITQALVKRTHQVKRGEGGRMNCASPVCVLPELPASKHSGLKTTERALKNGCHLKGSPRQPAGSAEPGFLFLLSSLPGGQREAHGCAEMHLTGKTAASPEQADLHNSAREGKRENPGKDICRTRCSSSSSRHLLPTGNTGRSHTHQHTRS